MTEDEKNAIENRLNVFYDNAKQDGGELIDPEKMVADANLFGITKEDLELDYKEEMENTLSESKEIITNMASLYLNEDKTLVSNNYVKNKIYNDAQNLSDMMFLQKIAKRAIVKQMQQIEMGDATPRHYETLSIMMREIRENIKQSTLTVSTMEDFYLKIRTQMGIDTSLKADEIEDSSKNNNIITTNDMNSKLEEIIKKRQNKE